MLKIIQKVLISTYQDDSLYGNSVNGKAKQILFLNPKQDVYKDLMTIIFNNLLAHSFLLLFNDSSRKLSRSLAVFLILAFKPFKWLTQPSPGMKSPTWKLDPTFEKLSKYILNLLLPSSSPLYFLPKNILHTPSFVSVIKI